MVENEDGKDDDSDADLVLLSWGLGGGAANAAGTGTLHKCRFAVIPICQQSSK